MVESIFRVTIIAIIIAIVIGIIGTVSFGWTLNTSTYLQGLTGFLHVIYYILPMKKLSPILYCFIGLMTFRIIISLIKTIWNLLPIAGYFLLYLQLVMFLLFIN